jgi:hypothetical protein
MAVAAAQFHSMAIGTDGKAYAWGDVWPGQGLEWWLGTYENDGVSPIPDQTRPAPVIGNKTFTQISTNDYATLGLGSDGTVYAWGACVGRLVGGTCAPTALTTSVKFSKIAMGGVGAALSTTGGLYTLGYDPSLPGSGSGFVLTPVQQLAGKTFTAIGAGLDNVSAIASDGVMYMYGSKVAGLIDPLVDNTNWQTPPVSAAPPSYRIEGPSVRSIQAGSSDAIDFHVTTVLGGFNARGTFQQFMGNITFTVENLPSGVTASFVPSGVSAGTAYTQLRIAVSPGAATGIKTITIRGTSPGLTDKTFTFPLEITAPPGGSSSGGTANLDCTVPSSVTAPYHCMTNSAGQKAPGRYDYTSIHGQWADEEAEICIDWKSTGKAAVKFKGGSWSADKDWGVLVNRNGVPSGSATQWYIFTEAADAQTALLGYDSSANAIVGWHFVKKTCPF